MPAEKHSSCFMNARDHWYVLCSCNSPLWCGGCEGGVWFSGIPFLVVHLCQHFDYEHTVSNPGNDLNWQHSRLLNFSQGYP